MVDDEPRALKSLRILLDKYCSEVQVIGEASNISTAYQQIIDMNPRIVFLDINMPDGSGLDLLKKIQGMDVEVIFTTAHQEYAIKALRLSALDYLLKPIDHNELVAAVNKYASLKHSNSQGYSLVSEILNSEKLKRLAISTVEGIKILKVTDILYVGSDKNYSTFHLPEQNFIASKSLGEYEKLLKDHHFVRIHRSTMINLERLLEYKKGKDSRVLLDDGTELEVSRNRKEELLTRISLL